MERNITSIDKIQVLLITIALAHYAEYLLTESELPDFVNDALIDHINQLIDMFDNMVETNS